MLLLDEQLQMYVSCRTLHTLSGAYTDHDGYQSEKKKQIRKVVNRAIQNTRCVFIYYFDYWYKVGDFLGKLL